MLRSIILSVATLLAFTWNSFSQLSPIVLAENTLKVEAFGEQIFYYGFAEGDQMVFDFEEVKGKELKEVEIMELPNSSKFMDYKTKKIENKTITVTQTGIYKFRFTNTGLGGRICRFKIQRIPASESTRNFNCSVFWKTINDTVIVPGKEKFLIKSDTTAVTVVDQLAKISSQTALNGNSNRTIVDFTLPDNTISWSYYIGVGTEGLTAYKEANDKFLGTAANLVSQISGYGTMAALALHGLNYFSKVQGQDNVKYWFISDWNSVQLFMKGNSFMQYKQGDVVNDAYQMKAPLTGKVYLALLNDNIMDPIEVTVKATAITIQQTWENRTVDKVSISSRSEPYLKN